MLGKRGQELSIGTLVLIVLGIIVLVLLVLGFSMGWDNLFGKIGIYQGSDLSSLIASCKIAVSTKSKGSYCEFKMARIDGKKAEVNCEYSAVYSSLEEKLDECPREITGLYCVKKDSSIINGLKSDSSACKSYQSQQGNS